MLLYPVNEIPDASYSCQVFTSVALFNMLISPLNAFPWVLNGLMEAWVSVKRIQAFLALDNLDLTGYYQQPNHSDKEDGKCWLNKYFLGGLKKKEEKYVGIVIFSLN